MDSFEAINTNIDGITFLSTGRYYDGINQWVAHKMKEGDSDAINYAARRMALLLPSDAVIVPIPGHHGKAVQTLSLAQAISNYTKLPIADILIGNDRESCYEAKLRNQYLSEGQIGFRCTTPLPQGKIPYLVDNVVDTGATARAAFNALGGGIVLSYAMSDTLLEEELDVSRHYCR